MRKVSRNPYQLESWVDPKLPIGKKKKEGRVFGRWRCGANRREVSTSLKEGKLEEKASGGDHL